MILDGSQNVHPVLALMLRIVFSWKIPIMKRIVFFLRIPSKVICKKASFTNNINRLSSFFLIFLLFSINLEPCFGPRDCEKDGDSQMQVKPREEPSKNVLFLSLLELYLFRKIRKNWVVVFKRNFFKINESRKKEETMNEFWIGS